MRKSWKTRVKKLSLAYETGWEYMPESDEAGSVLTNIFLEMERENLKRCDRIWEKHKLTFLQAVPEYKNKTVRCKGALIVKTTGENHGKWINADTGVYTVTENGTPVRFQTVDNLQLTAAKLRYAVYRKGLSAWLSYESGMEEQKQIFLFQPVGKVLAFPVFRWKFEGLCDGRESFCFGMEFNKKHRPGQVLAGKWTVTDGVSVFPADWEETSSGFCLKGQTPEFAGNLEEKVYEVRLEFPAGEEPPGEWLDILRGGFVLKETAQNSRPDLCMTDFDAGSGQKVFPFGRNLAEASCCYLACDRAMTGKNHEIAVRFTESFETEEKLPRPRGSEYKKLYKKYPWLENQETVQEWCVAETVWEYFNGDLWCLIPGSKECQTGCGDNQPGERTYRWKRPKDMQPCAVEGKEHFYIRLRLNRVRNAYAAYYRKRIPVLEEIRFETEERHMAPEEQYIPDCPFTDREEMFFGFDRDVTPDNCWYTGEKAFSFKSEQIKGRDVLFGLNAFWVKAEEQKEGVWSCCLPNYVTVLPLYEEADEELPVQQICKETAFYLETTDMGVMDAVCTTDMRYGGTCSSALQKEQAAEHYLTHMERLLTLADMETMLQEKYPMLWISSCRFSQTERQLYVTAAFCDIPGKDNRITEWTREEKKDRIAEIEEWMENVLSQAGPVWLSECHVSFCLEKTSQREEEMNHAGTDIAG